MRKFKSRSRNDWNSRSPPTWLKWKSCQNRSKNSLHEIVHPAPDAQVFETDGGGQRPSSQAFHSKIYPSSILDCIVRPATKFGFTHSSPSYIFAHLQVVTSEQLCQSLLMMPSRRILKETLFLVARLAILFDFKKRVLEVLCWARSTPRTLIRNRKGCLRCDIVRDQACWLPSRPNERCPLCQVVTP